MSTNWIIEITFDEDTPEATVKAVSEAVEAILAEIPNNALLIVRQEESEAEDG